LGGARSSTDQLRVTDASELVLRSKLYKNGGLTAAVRELDLDVFAASRDTSERHSVNALAVVSRLTEESCE